MTDAPAVLLLHGFATSAARTWGENGWLDVLGDTGRTVLAPDLLGHGTAPKPHDPEAYTDIAGAVAETLPDTPIDGVGFSLGARTLLQLAVRRPRQFRRLVLAGVGANLFRTERANAINRALRGDAAPEDPVARYFAGLAAHPDADPEALVALTEAGGVGGRPFTAEELSVVTCPTLVVLGDDDFAGPADPLVEALPDARLVTLPRTDHFATPKAFKFMDATLDFLEG